MANYPGASSFPNLNTLQVEFNDQSISNRYSTFTLRFCEKADIAIEDLVNASIIHLQSSRHTGILDLLEFMNFLIRNYRVNYNPNSQILYKAVKGLPYHSKRKIGYTFGRREKGIDRGVFIFLR